MTTDQFQFGTCETNPTCLWSGHTGRFMLADQEDFKRPWSVAYWPLPPPPASEERWGMTVDEAKIAELKFAIEMAQATRLATIEECAKVADRIAAAYNDDKDGDADARVAAEWVASELRSLSQPNLGKE